MGITTLRSIKCGIKIEYLFENKDSINQGLNLCNSLKNLTFYFDILPLFVFANIYKKSIENILEKKYYYNLENVNILVDFQVCDQYDKEVDYILGIFKKHIKLLKYQFKQLNVAFYNIKEACYVWEWNSNIDHKFLDQVKHKFCFEQQDVVECNKHKEKMMQLSNQWV